MTTPPQFADVSLPAGAEFGDVWQDVETEREFPKPCRL
jgi:hypothetical protein